MNTRVKVPKCIVIGTSQILRFVGQPREVFDELEIHQLGESIKKIGQQQAVSATQSEENPGMYDLIDGECRWRACQDAGVTEMFALLFDNVDDFERYKRSLVCNFYRKGHTHKETFNALKKLHEGGCSVREIQLITGKSDAWVYEYLALGKLVPSVFDKLVTHDKKPKTGLGYRAAVKLSRVPKDKQVQIYMQAMKAPKRKRMHVLNGLVDVEVQPQKREVRPKDLSDYRRMFESSLAKIFISSETLLMKIPNKMFQKIIGNFSREAMQTQLDEINQCIDNLTELRDSIQNAAGTEVTDDFTELAN